MSTARGVGQSKDKSEDKDRKCSALERDLFLSFQSSAEMQAIKCVVVGDGAVGEFS